MIDSAISLLLIVCLGLLLATIKAYLSQKGKNRALREDNAALVEQRERIKSEHQLESAKRKHQYEARLTAYNRFFEFFDESGRSSAEALQQRILPKLLNVLLSPTTGQPLAPEIPFEIRMQSLISEIFETSATEQGQTISRLKNQANTLKLFAPVELVTKLDRLVFLISQEFQSGMDAMKSIDINRIMSDPATAQIEIVRNPDVEEEIDFLFQTIRKLAREDLERI